ncbi:MAG: peptidase M61 [Ekhidna sp.]|nr:peptidase M61 [Ekhidna sp.]
MRNIASLTALLIVSLGFSQDKYQVSIDLTKAKNDKVPVEISVPKTDQEEIEYHMPKIVPGTYSISDFGRFVVGFKALDKNGDQLEFEKISTNRWLIKNAALLDKITYRIEDSFDNFSGYGKNKLFEPGGTSIESEEGVFVMNTFGFIGYMDGEKFRPFELTIIHDEKIKGTTSLKKIKETSTSDTYTTENYHSLADAPLMYCEPDIVSKEIAGANILVSVYSPNKVLSAKDVMDNIDELMEAQASYLGGKLPVDRYTYLIYLFDSPTLSGSWGALEHSYSSLYALPEMEPGRISQMVKDISAHEFLHIVTPLNIHSEEIHNFNYIKPEMSQHLWLYEGVTEYSTHHVQIKYDLYEIDDFLNEMRNKIIRQVQYDVDIPYTEFSKNILEGKNEKRYGDVYAGGALIAMCLDLTIIKSTNGEKDLQWLLQELSKEYGPMKAFKDEDLFDEIERGTSPEAGDFLRKYVAGVKPLPLKEVLEWAGIDYAAESENNVIATGNFTPALNDQQEISIASTKEMDDFGKKLGLLEGDVLLTWNGEKLTFKNFQQIMDRFYKEVNEGDKVEVLIRRKIWGKEKEKKLKAKAIIVKSFEKHTMNLTKNPTEEQLRIRNAWLNAQN